MMKDLAIIETILRNRVLFFDQVRGAVGLGGKIRAMLISCAVFLSIYGLVMGFSNSIPQAISSAIKLPILFLLTLIICTPSLHFFNILFGSKQSLPQTITMILTGMTTTSVILLSFAPVTFFFLTTSNQYQFFKLLNVVFFGIGGAMGLVFLRQGVQMISETDNLEGVGTRRLILVIWIVLYGFVGTQMGWTLRPFFGDPGMPFELVRQVGGNFYADILHSLSTLLATL
jgi:hypothetical protein